MTEPIRSGEFDGELRVWQAKYFCDGVGRHAMLRSGAAARSQAVHQRSQSCGAATLRLRILLERWLALGQPDAERGQGRLEREPALGGLLVLRAHVATGLAHRPDDLVEA